MRVLLSIIITIILSISVFGAGVVYDGTVVQQLTDDDIVTPDYMKISNGTLEEPKSWWENIFGQGAFSFVSETYDRVYMGGFELKGSYGWFYAEYGRDPATGKIKAFGKNCDVGDYIVSMRGEKLPSGEIIYYRQLFDNMWYKSHETDYIILTNYYTKDIPELYYYYECWHRLPVEDAYYICENGKYRDVFGLISGTCEYGCKIDYSNADINNEDDLKNIMCKGTPNDVNIQELDITLQDIQAPSEVEVGDVFSITGLAVVEYQPCVGCVIETSMNTTLGAKKLSVIELESEHGVCGDDVTTGVKFDANPGDVIIFKLWYQAKEEGTWDVPVGAYSRCGGSLLDRKYVRIKVNPKSSPKPTYDDKVGETVYEDTPSKVPSETNVVPTPEVITDPSPSDLKNEVYKASDEIKQEVKKSFLQRLLEAIIEFFRNLFS